jgi:uncharacterized protein GlcG (DUF336 family)
MKLSVQNQVIHWQAAQLAAVAAVEHAEKLSIAINVAIVDSGGNPAAFLRMPNAFLHSIKIAKDKAYTAAGFRFATSEWKDIFANEESLKIGMPNRHKIVVFGGGIPIVVNDNQLGGIGVSGGTEQQDIECAQVAIDALKSAA